MTAKQNVALAWLRRAREDDPSTDDGVVTSVATFYDAEVAVAYVHWATARALERAGRVEITYDPDGSQITLARASRRGMPSAQPESSGGAVSREGET